ncbi:MAG: hypothetical protein AAFQ89_10535 [Cyanobacteria bacterium J06626_18]
MSLVVCPGAHPLTWTQAFLRQLDESFPERRLVRHVFPAHEQSPWSAYALRLFLESVAIAPTDPLIFIAFSAGCVAAAGVANDWVAQGRPTPVVIALDGWGVPLPHTFPSYRLSHDRFTHETSAWLGSGNASFYADPPVSHQQLWCNPAKVRGRQVGRFPVSEHPIGLPTTALQFLAVCVGQHFGHPVPNSI